MPLEGPTMVGDDAIIGYVRCAIRHNKQAKRLCDTSSYLIIACYGKIFHEILPYMDLEFMYASFK